MGFVKFVPLKFVDRWGGEKKAKQQNKELKQPQDIDIEGKVYFRGQPAKNSKRGKYL